MTDELNAQVSAYLDEELHDSESELLVRRLCADAGLRNTLGRFMLIGDAIRPESVTVPEAFASRVAAALGGQQVRPAIAVPAAPASRGPWQLARPAVAAAIAAVVAVSAVLALRMTATTDVTQIARAGLEHSETVPLVADGANSPAVNFTVPASMPMGRRTAIERARINKYLITHSEYAATAGRNGMLPYRSIGISAERDTSEPSPDAR